MVGCSRQPSGEKSTQCGCARHPDLGGHDVRRGVDDRDGAGVVIGQREPLPSGVTAARNGLLRIGTVATEFVWCVQHGERGDRPGLVPDADVDRAPVRRERQVLAAAPRGTGMVAVTRFTAVSTTVTPRLAIGDVGVVATRATARKPGSGRRGSGADRRFGTLAPPTRSAPRTPSRGRPPGPGSAGRKRASAWFMGPAGARMIDRAVRTRGLPEMRHGPGQVAQVARWRSTRRPPPTSPTFPPARRRSRLRERR